MSDLPDIVALDGMTGPELPETEPDPVMEMLEYIAEWAYRSGRTDSLSRHVRVYGVRPNTQFARFVASVINGTFRRTKRDANLLRDHRVLTDVYIESRGLEHRRQDSNDWRQAALAQRFDVELDNGEVVTAPDVEAQSRLRNLQDIYDFVGAHHGMSGEAVEKVVKAQRWW